MKHHLFAATHWLLKAATLLAGFIIAVLALTLGGLGVVAASAGHFGIPASLHGVARSDALAIAAFAVACGLICIVLVFLALRVTIDIIKTAIAGDPFVNENARRLARIGWLLLAVEAIGFSAHPVFNSLVAHAVPENLRTEANFHFGDFGFGISPVGLLAVLLIFVLAQIFRRGSEMRTELEATV
jgi:hypothetical protein